MVRHVFEKSYGVQFIEIEKYLKYACNNFNIVSSF